MSGEPRLPLAVVLAPDLVGRACVAPAAGEVLALWRDQRIRPVLNRSLVICYLRLWHRLGLSDKLIRRWGWWFGSGRKVVLVEPDTPGLSPIELCESLARSAQVPWIIHGGSAEELQGREALAGETGCWIEASEFLRRARQWEPSSAD